MIHLFLDLLSGDTEFIISMLIPHKNFQVFVRIVVFLPSLVQYTIYIAADLILIHFKALPLLSWARFVAIRIVGDTKFIISMLIPHKNFQVFVRIVVFLPSLVQYTIYIAVDLILIHFKALPLLSWARFVAIRIVSMTHNMLI